MAEFNGEVLPALPIEEEKLVWHMPYNGKRCLTELLRPRTARGNNWKLLADKLGFTSQQILNLEEELDPVDKMLTRCLDLTISRLKVCLEEMQRFDVLDELRPFEEQTLTPIDYERRQQERGNEDQLSTNPTILPVHQMYDAFICYAREDLSFAQEILEKLESPPYHLRLCINYRDFLPGQSSLATAARVIEERCERIVVILSENFNRDQEADFQAMIALSLSPGCRDRRLIPIKYTQCSIPIIYRFITHLDYTMDESRRYFWRNLTRSLGYTN